MQSIEAMTEQILYWLSPAPACRATASTEFVPSWLRLTAFNLSLVPIRDVPLPVPIYPSLGTGGNGMDKGDFRSSPAPGISAKIHRFSCSPAAAVTTYAAAGIPQPGPPPRLASAAAPP